MKYLVFTPLLPPERFGGIEIIVYELIESLCKYGREITVITGGSSEQEEESVLPSGIRVYRIPAKFDTSIAIQKANDMAIDLIDRLSLDFEVLHCHDWFFSIASLKLKHRRQLTIVAIMHLCKKMEYLHLPDSNKSFHDEIIFMQEKLATSADILMNYSNYMDSLSFSVWGVKPKQRAQFRCGLTQLTSDFSWRYKRLNIKHKPQILYIGRLAAEKDVSTLLYACAILQSTGYSFELKIVGSGRDESNLRQINVALGLQDMTEWTPFTPDPLEVKRFMCKADLLVLPSIYEPFGMILLEAIACLLPIITVNYGGPSEIIQNFQTGLTFTPKDTFALADAIKEVFRHPMNALNRAEIALREGVKNYSWDLAATKLIEVSELHTKLVK